VLSCRQPDGTTKYIEVKSSAQEQLHIFYITPRELEAAAKYKEHYTIARVFGCPEATCRPAVPTSGTAALVAGDLPERFSPNLKKQPKLARLPQKVAQVLTHRQVSQLQGRTGHTRLLFMQDPIELLRRKVVRLALEI
jgi:hypothetical protein